jgi:hypothetical protein
MSRVIPHRTIDSSRLTAADEFLNAAASAHALAQLTLTL